MWKIWNASVGCSIHRLWLSPGRLVAAKCLRSNNKKIHSSHKSHKTKCTSMWPPNQLSEESFTITACYSAWFEYRPLRITVHFEKTLPHRCVLILWRLIKDKRGDPLSFPSEDVTWCFNNVEYMLCSTLFVQAQDVRLATVLGNWCQILVYLRRTMSHPNITCHLAFTRSVKLICLTQHSQNVWRSSIPTNNASSHAPQFAHKHNFRHSLA